MTGAITDEGSGFNRYNICARRHTTVLSHHDHQGPSAGFAFRSKLSVNSGASCLTMHKESQVFFRRGTAIIASWAQTATG